MYFPPSFFDIMVHLIVHLAREIRLCGPVYLRWMYPIERYMKILKGYVKNPYRPEASIVERYVTEEAIEFCSEYLSEAKPVGLPKSRHEGRYEGKGTQGLKVKRIGRLEMLQAHLYILNNNSEVEPYFSAHKTIVKDKNPRMSEKWVLMEHNKTFLDWFKSQVMNDDSASDTLKWLAHEPRFEVLTWSSYDIHNMSFSTKSRDDKSTVQNSGVMIMASAMHFSSAKDKNPVFASITYFGVIEEIWELDYCKFRIPILKCKWVNNNGGVQTDEFGFTLVDLEKVGYRDEPYIMADQAQQVFFVTDPSNKKWSVVLQGKTVHGNIKDQNSSLHISDTPSFSRFMPTFTEEREVDNVHATRDDHNEGILEDIRI